MNRQLIREARQARGWTQEDLAREAGLAQSLVGALESGYRDSARISTLRKLSATLNVSVDALLAEPINSEAAPPAA